MPRPGKDGKNKIRKGAGLLPQQRRALEDDAYEEDYDGDQHEDYRQKRLDEDAGFDDGLPGTRVVMDKSYPTTHVLLRGT